MFKILQKTFSTGIATNPYPQTAALVSEHFRGRPAFDFAAWQDARPAAEACPTGAIAVRDRGLTREVAVDYGLCVFCGECARVSYTGGVRMTREFELAARSREDLRITAQYELYADGTHKRLVSTDEAGAVTAVTAEMLGREVERTVRQVLGRSLAIREVDAGSCNGCELEIVALNNPVHDIERFGIHFVASPRHADMLLVTGPVTRNMEMALRKTFDATPHPRVVAAAGACGISGGIFGASYASIGAVDRVIPVDVYIPGCPPRPEALLHGILLAVYRLVET
ncbi:MAG: NADH-quinone oxidoreductase subunit NuoB [Acidobacteriia bacterium]|nr:NADH-quinone oxidoreductase subunit NuoB [Terriglobia bacterium]